ncbi:MAG: hypothetical protein ACRDTG_09715 [Pseudonocardiaceae bacterium]
MALETAFEDIVPLIPEEEEKRGKDLEYLLELAGGPRERGLSPKGPWDFVRGAGPLFSAPHEVAQLRDGVEKVAERGTADLAFSLAHATGGSGLATAVRQLGDPNWELNHPYIAKAVSLAGDWPIIDLHMMRPRGLEICIGLGPEPKMSALLWRPFMEEAVASGLRVSVNWPFGANPRTVTGQIQRQGRRAIQLELSWECYDRNHPAMRRSWSALMRASRRLVEDLSIGLP